MVNGLANFKALSGFSGRQRVRDDGEVVFIMELKVRHSRFMKHMFFSLSNRQGLEDNWSSNACVLHDFVVSLTITCSLYGQT